MTAHGDEPNHTQHSRGNLRIRKGLIWAFTSIKHLKSLIAGQEWPRAWWAVTAVVETVATRVSVGSERRPLSLKLTRFDISSYAYTVCYRGN